MNWLHYSGIFIVSVLFFAQIAGATHQVTYRIPPTIITTVGGLTTVQLDIQNPESSPHYYNITIAAGARPNEMEITNPSINTKILNPGESISVFTNIRTLTENPNTILIKIYHDSDMSHFFPNPPISIPVQSKKFSLPEFNLFGLMQIIILASLMYFFVNKNSVDIRD